MSIVKKKLEFEERVLELVPQSELDHIMNDNVYKSILYGVPFRIADEYAYYTKKYSYSDPRRLIGALSEVYYTKLNQGHTTWTKLTDQIEKRNGKPILLGSGSLHDYMTRVLLQSNDLFTQQEKLLEWYENKDGKTIPRLNTHLFYSTLENINDIRKMNKKVFQFSEHQGKSRLIHLPSFWSEQQISSRIYTLLTEKTQLQTTKEEAKRKALELGADIEQATAISEAFGTKVSIITGGPGTGKSQTISMLATILLEENKDLSIRICSPTGRAARNVQERLLSSKSTRVREYFNSDENKCKTIHSLLKIKPSSGLGNCRTKYSFKDTPLDADVVIIDEAGMIDIYLMRSLLWAIPNHAHVVIVGDQNQLNSIGPGKVLYDLTIGLEKINKKEPLSITPSWTKLNTMHRTKESSRLPFLAATLLIENEEERWSSFQKELRRCIDNGDVLYYPTDDLNDSLNMTVREYIKRYKNEEDIALITPRHEEGIGRNKLNETIQKKVIGTTKFVRGLPIIQNQTNHLHGVVNGERGIITAASGDQITAEFDNDRVFTLPLEEAEKQWLVGFATTVHKSQGSEAETVILPIWTQPKTKIWDRTLLYTAFTRSKKQVVIISNEEWLEKTVKLKGNYRLSRLPILYRAKVKKTND